VFRDISEEKSRAQAVVAASKQCKPEYEALVACKKAPGDEGCALFASSVRKCHAMVSVRDSLPCSSFSSLARAPCPSYSP
jgi:cytochrome c5